MIRFTRWHFFYKTPHTKHQILNEFDMLRIYHRQINTLFMLQKQPKHTYFQHQIEMKLSVMRNVCEKFVLKWIGMRFSGGKGQGFQALFLKHRFSDIQHAQKINDLLRSLDKSFYNLLFFQFELNRTPATMPCWEVFDP
jgi:hypothetical protein